MLLSWLAAETVPFKSVSGTASSDAAFVSLLARTAASPSNSPDDMNGRRAGKGAADRQQEAQVGRLGKLQLAEQDIAKVGTAAVGSMHSAQHGSWPSQSVGSLCIVAGSVLWETGILRAFAARGMPWQCRGPASRFC